MHPEIAKTLVAQRRDELVQQTTSGQRTGRRRLPRWHVSWTRDRAGPGRRARSRGRQPRRPGWPARFVPGDHHLGPPFGLRSPRAGYAAVLPFANSAACYLPQCSARPIAVGNCS